MRGEARFEENRLQACGQRGREGPSGFELQFTVGHEQASILHRLPELGYRETRRSCFSGFSDSLERHLDSFNGPWMLLGSSCILKKRGEKQHMPLRTLEKLIICKRLTSEPNRDPFGQNPRNSHDVWFWFGEGSGVSWVPGMMHHECSWCFSCLFFVFFRTFC